MASQPSSTGGGSGTEKGTEAENENNILPFVMAENVVTAAAAGTAVVSLDVPATTITATEAQAEAVSAAIASADPRSSSEILVVTFDDDDVPGHHGAVNEATPLVMSSGRYNNTNNQQQQDIAAGGSTTPMTPQRQNFDGREQSDQSSIASASNKSSSQSSSGPQFRDWPFALVFWIHLAAVVYVGVKYSTLGFQRMAEDFDYDEVQKAIAAQDDVTPEDMEKFSIFVDEVLTYLQGYPLRILVYQMIPLALVVLVILDLTIGIVLKYFSVVIVRSTLVCSVMVPFVVLSLMVVAEPTVFSILLTMIIVGSTGYFVIRAWPLSKFAAINLKFAIEALNNNMGIYLWSMFFAKFSVCWVVGWLYVFLGIHFLQHINCEEMEHPDESKLLQWEGHEDDDCHLSSWTLLGLIISLYWTTNVIVSYVQVTVAGVTATWLYDKDAATGCCSSAVWGSLQRAGTYSFGSICLGSLLQGLVGVLRWFVQGANSQRINSNSENCCGALCSCIVDCIAHIGGPILDYFSQWNYSYIAIYGESYLSSGKKVTELFKRKGWQSIITERLDNYVLGWVVFGVGLVAGAMALLLERIVTMYHPETEYESWVYGPLPHWWLACFGIGMIFGVVSASCMMRVIKGGINTLIVCWADHPHQIESNHPALSEELIDEWSTAFPKSFFYLPPVAEASAV
mmetsp:Transcript_3966/g.9699  ORF Transcript_3966/g.9699 Transcript_3966/m.9699 type:complete len:681 (-) Transcript_3966:1947-3989(-)